MDEKRKKQSEVRDQSSVGRDEMRLLEFAISGAARKVDRNISEVVFTDSVTNPATRLPVDRTVRIAFADGRPTPTDEDVLVALLSLTHQVGFDSPKISFSRAGVCAELGWQLGGRQYQTIETALRRWVGVRIYAENYYFDERTKGMVDRHFGIIEDVELQDRERYKALQLHTDERYPMSFFRWSDVMHESFESGMIKKLDLKLYRNIENGVARKLYRYLDMYFWRQPKQEFDLANLMHQKLGFSAINDSYELKRRIKPAIEELEELGVIAPESVRFDTKGKRTLVKFTKQSVSKRKESKRRKVTPPLVQELIAVGVEAKASAKFVTSLSAERVRDDIDHAQLLDKRGEVRSSVAGFVFKLLSAEESFTRPKGFVSAGERVVLKRKVAASQAAKQAEAQRKDELRREAEDYEQAMVNDYLKNLPTKEAREAVKQEALRENPFAAGHYRDAIREGRDGKNWLDTALKSFVKSKLETVH